MTDALAKGIGTGFVGALGLMLLFWAVEQDRHEQQLVADGYCSKITETLYTPPPRASTHCYGPDGSRWCSTSYSQPDPYMRSLWRCRDPEKQGQRVEFWRRTSEEAGR